MDVDVLKCCRICLKTESDHVPILGDPTIHLHIKSCLALNISSNDDLPKTICSTCVTQLAEFYNFQLNAHCSQDWLTSSLEEKAKKFTETKTPIQPLPDSEYNSDSLLEFLNNTANIEEYLNNLGKEDIPSIVNLLDRNENTIVTQTKQQKVPTPKKKDNLLKQNVSVDIKMEIDVLDSDIPIVKEILLKETDPKAKIKIFDKTLQSCFACQEKFDTISKLTHHLSVCDIALRTCTNCNMLFDSKHKLQQHYFSHGDTPPFSCNCGKQFENKENLSQHQKTCHVDHGAAMGCVYRCKECGESFEERFQIFRHAREHVQKSSQRVCDICGHSFRGEDALNKHRKEEHNKSNNVTYRCKVCDITTKDRKEMYMHVQKHTSTSGQPTPNRHLCESCGRSFASQWSLTRHLAHHEVNHKCSTCFEKFATDRLLQEHMLEHNKVIMCERCGQTVNGYKIQFHTCI